MIYILTDGFLNQKMVKKENPVQLLDLVVKHERSTKKMVLYAGISDYKHSRKIQNFYPKILRGKYYNSIVNLHELFPLNTLLTRKRQSHSKVPSSYL